MNSSRVSVPFAVAMIALCRLPLGLAAAEDDKPGFEKWEPAIQAFEQRDREDPPPKGAVLFVGSSSIRLWDLEQSYPGRRMINRGFGGSQIADSTHFVERLVLKHEPRVVVMYAGDNDIAAGKPPQRVAADFESFVAAVHKRLPETRIVFIAIKPSRARWMLFERMSEANRLIGERCRNDQRLEFLDVVRPMLDEHGLPRAELFVKDGLHLNAEGYRLWAKLLGPHLRERAAPPPAPGRPRGGP